MKFDFLLFSWCVIKRKTHTFLLLLPEALFFPCVCVLSHVCLSRISGCICCTSVERQTFCLPLFFKWKKIPFFFDKKLEIDECVYTRRAEIKTTTRNRFWLCIWQFILLSPKKKKKQRKAFTKTFFVKTIDGWASTTRHRECVYPSTVQLLNFEIWIYNLETKVEKGNWSFEIDHPVRRRHTLKLKTQHLPSPPKKTNVIYPQEEKQKLLVQPPQEVRA